MFAPGFLVAALILCRCIVQGFEKVGDRHVEHRRKTPEGRGARVTVRLALDVEDRAIPQAGALAELTLRDVAALTEVGYQAAETRLCARTGRHGLLTRAQMPDDFPTLTRKEVALLSLTEVNFRC